MSHVRGKGNKATEIVLVQLFRMNHISGWRRRIKVFGNPDFAFRKHRLAVFVDGCFWHGCPRHGTLPATNRVFWRKKLERNVGRDRLVSVTLRKEGWRVVRIWQHELTKKNEPRLAGRLRRMVEPSID